MRAKTKSFELISSNNKTVEMEERAKMATKWLEEQGLTDKLTVEEVLKVPKLVKLLDELIEKEQQEKRLAEEARQKALLDKLAAAMAAELGHKQEVVVTIMPEEDTMTSEDMSDFAVDVEDRELEEDDEIPEWQRMADARGDILEKYGKDFLPEFVWDGAHGQSGDRCAAGMCKFLIELVKPAHKLRNELRNYKSVLARTQFEMVTEYIDYLQRYIDAVHRVICKYYGYETVHDVFADRHLLPQIMRSLQRDKRFRSMLNPPSVEDAQAKLDEVKLVEHRVKLVAEMRQILNAADPTTKKGLHKSLARKAVAELEPGMDATAMSCLKMAYEQLCSMKDFTEKLPHARALMLAMGFSEDDVRTKFVLHMHIMMDKHEFVHARKVASFLRMSQDDFICALKERALAISTNMEGLPLWLEAGGNEDSFIDAMLLKV